MPNTLARFAPWLGRRAARLADDAAGEPPVQSFESAGDARLLPCALDSVVAGTPTARASTEAVSADGRLSTGLWDCTAGVLEIHFDCDEQVHILEGEVTIRQGGRVHELRPGSVAWFPAGTVARWEIGRYVKKVYVQRTLPRSLARRVANKLRRLAGLGD